MKKIMIAGMLLTMIIAMVGCGNVKKEESSKDGGSTSETVTSNDLTEPVDEEYYVSPTDEYNVGEVITVGEIMMFDGNKIHIISGDLVQVYEYDSSVEKKFYINQTVSLIKSEKNNELEVFLNEDFSVKHTNMGHMLEEVSGTITEIDDESMTVETEDDKVMIKVYSDHNYAVGRNVTAVVGDFGEGKSLVYLLEEDSKLILTVNEITRTEEGFMVLNLSDSEGGEYSVGTSGAILELNLSEIEVGDELTFYHEGIMESWPMQLATVLIRK